MGFIAGIIEGIVALLVAVIQAIVGLFVEGATSLGGAEAFGLLFLLFIEFIWWAALFIVELAFSLFRWRKPRRISKPILWRPKRLRDKSAADENT